MSSTTQSPPATPGTWQRTTPAWVAALLCVAWILPGLVGHDPWKPDEAYSFGLVYHMLQTGDWVVPTLAGEPFMEKPPVFYLVATFMAWLFQGWLPLHDGARLASGVFLGATLACVGAAARLLLGGRTGWLAALALLGCVGLVERAHQLITDNAQLTGFALGLLGLALSLRRPVWGGLVLGTGAGVAFLAKGLLGPGCLGLTSLALPLLYPRWRTRAYLGTLLVAAAAALPWILIWPLLLWQRAPALFDEWLWVNNLGRFLGQNNLGPKAVPGQYLAILPWYAMPAWPLALWALWRGRHEFRAAPWLHLPATFFACVFLVLSLSHDARELYAMPMLPPLAILAVPGLFSLRRGASRALLWFSMVFFSVFALVGWFYWAAMDLSFPVRLHHHLMDMQPGYVAASVPLRAVLGLLLSAAWVVLLRRAPAAPERPLVLWAGGSTLVWGLLVILFMGYADTGKSYGSMVRDIQAHLPASYRCMGSRNLGEPQRALLDYWAGIRTQRVEVPGQRRDCDLQLVQGFRSEIAEPGPGWRLLWEGARLGDNKELYRLFQRMPEGEAP